MYFQCVLILALSLVQNEAAERFSFSQRPGRAFPSGSPKRIQGSFDTAAELAKLIQKVKKELVDEKDRFHIQPNKKYTSPEDETYLQALFNVVQKKIDDNEGIRIHVLKNAGMLDSKNKKDLGSRAVFIDNPEVLEKYIKELKNQKTEGPQNLLLKRRNAVFRLEEREHSSEIKFNLQDSKHKRKRYGGEISEEISKRFNKVTNNYNEREREMNSGKKQRNAIDQSRVIRKPVTENRDYVRERVHRGFKNEREDRVYKNQRESHDSNKREFKDYPEFKKQGNPNLAQTRTTKVADYEYDKPRKPKKVLKDYDDGFDSKKRNKYKFDDYGRNKNKGVSRGQSMGSESRKKPVPKMDWTENPKRNFDNNERRPKKENDWAPSIRGGSNDYYASKNNEGYGFGNTPIPFNRPRNIYVDERDE